MHNNDYCKTVVAELVSTHTQIKISPLHVHDHECVCVRVCVCVWVGGVHVAMGACVLFRALCVHVHGVCGACSMCRCV